MLSAQSSMSKSINSRSDESSVIRRVLEELVPSVAWAVDHLTRDGMAASQSNLLEEAMKSADPSACCQVVLRLAKWLLYHDDDDGDQGWITDELETVKTGWTISNHGLGNNFSSSVSLFSSKAQATCIMTNDGTVMVPHAAKPQKSDALRAAASVVANPFLMSSSIAETSVDHSLPKQQAEEEEEDDDAVSAMHSTLDIQVGISSGKKIFCDWSPEREVASQYTEPFGESIFKPLCNFASLKSVASDDARGMVSLRPLESLDSSDDSGESLGHRTSSSMSTHTTPMMMIPPVFSVQSELSMESVKEHTSKSILPSISRSFVSVLKTSKMKLVEDEDDEILQINDYVIVGEAGRGNFGVVKIAVKEQVRESPVYAIKIVKKTKVSKWLMKIGKSNSISTCSFRSSAEDTHSGGALTPGGPPQFLMKPLSPKAPSSVPPSHGSRRCSVTLIPAEKDEPSPPANGKSRAAPNHYHPRVQDDVRREMEVMMRLRHPNIVSLFEIIDDPEHDNLYMVMPYCDRGPMLVLSPAGTCKPLDVDVARGYMRQITAGLAYLHSKRVAHMDIKPDNILLDSSHVCYLADFGTSEMLDKDTAVAFRGTPAFAAPEALTRTRDYDPFRADVWALGVTFYTMLFGHLPFRGSNIQELTECIVSTTRLSYESPPGGHDPSQSDAAIDLLKQLLDRDPLARPTAAEIQLHHFFGPRGPDQQRHVRTSAATEPKFKESRSHTL